MVNEAAKPQSEVARRPRFVDCRPKVMRGSPACISCGAESAHCLSIRAIQVRGKKGTSQRHLIHVAAATSIAIALQPFIFRRSFANVAESAYDKCCRREPFRDVLRCAL